ncbi:MAG: glycosyltransferase family 1 protein [Pseudomonadota bacterium]
MSKLLVVTDAWHPQINGVVRSLARTIDELIPMGIDIDILSPLDYPTIPCPTYPEIRLSLARPVSVRSRVIDGGADFFHLATEGPLGILAKRAILGAGKTYTTSYHTRFPEYVSARMPIPQSWSYAFLRRFHNGGNGCMVATKSLEDDLHARGFTNLMRWSRGVDHNTFRPISPPDLDLPKPVFVYVGRVAVEKNIEAFLKLDLPGSKLVVGGGPQLKSLARRYPDAVFTGPKVGDDLVAHYCLGDVFVFPSLTDTFGNVILEALACGLPVAAFPVTGPLDILSGTEVGVLDDDLRTACLASVGLSKTLCREFALQFTWKRCAEQFLDNVLIAHHNSTQDAA